MASCIHRRIDSFRRVEVDDREPIGDLPLLQGLAGIPIPEDREVWLLRADSRANGQDVGSIHGRKAEVKELTGEEAMKKDGWHHYTDTKGNSKYWCRCLHGKDHKTEPRFT